MVTTNCRSEDLVGVWEFLLNLLPVYPSSLLPSLTVLAIRITVVGQSKILEPTCFLGKCGCIIM